MEYLYGGFEGLGFNVMQGLFYYMIFFYQFIIVYVELYVGLLFNLCYLEEDLDDN